MHIPPKKIPKIFKNQITSGTALLIGRQLPDLPRFKDNKLRQTKHARSLIAKDRFFKLQDLQFQLNELKVDGKEISSSLNIDNIKIQKKTFQTHKTAIQTPTQQTVKVRSMKPKDTVFVKKEESPQKNNQKELFTQKENAFEDNVLPEIGMTLHSHPISEKKVADYKTYQKKSDREGFSIGKAMKRRDTMAETTTKNGGMEDSLKNKQQSKKILALMQYREFLLTIALTNRLFFSPGGEVQYKAYICKGNNGLLVKSIMKTRPWWSFRSSGDIDGCNLVWTEWKRNKSINQLAQFPSHQSLGKECDLPKIVIRSKNEEIKAKMTKKLNNYKKIIGKHGNLGQYYQNSMLSENYLSFSTKINFKHFEDTHLYKKINKQEFPIFDSQKDKILLNHIPGCFYLHSKKLLFRAISKYYQKLEKDVFNVIPVTFLISKGMNDPEFKRFCEVYESFSGKGKGEKKGNVWICKPGQNSNRGQGIEVVSSLAQIRSLVGQKCNSNRTLIIQKYMQNPFLYNKRKFDIRCYILITCVNGCVKGYWYQEMYIRTTSKEYNLKNLNNKLIHLTNDAIQKKGEEYGKFENNNKVSMAQLEKYIENTTEVKFSTIYDQIKEISVALIEAVSHKLNPQHKEFTFELFGLDYMLDDKLNPYLIEANSNPCLEVDGNVLGKVIPRMVENVIRVAIDPIFPPPYSQSNKNKFSPGNTFDNNQMELVYDSLFYNTLQSYQEPEQALENDREVDEFQGEIDEL